MAKILWIEDEPATIRWTAAELTLGGYEVGICRDAESGLRILEESSPAEYVGLIVDVLLPLGEECPRRLPPATPTDTAGVEVVRVLREMRDDLGALPVIAISGITAMGVWAQAKADLVNLGALVLEKPVSTESLLAVVEERFGPPH